MLRYDPAMADVALGGPSQAAVMPHASGDRAMGRATLLAIMLAVAFLTRCANLGDWNFEVDDQYFALIGDRMLAGDTLYVDIFDRKGPALYLLYAGLAVFGTSPVAYQLAATLCIALTGYGIARISALLGTARGGVVAGVAYCLLTAAFGGANGQTPVFYNPLIVACAWCVISRIGLFAQGRIDATVAAGFAAAALAIAFKMSAAFEGMFFGLAVVALLLRGGAPLSRTVKIAALLALLGLLPMLAAAGWYALAGNFDEFWQAVVTSNFARSYDAENRAARLSSAWLSIQPLVLIAGVGLISLRRDGRFGVAGIVLTGWLVTSGLAIGAFPTVYSHYLLTMLPPLCVAGAGLYRHPRWGAPLGLALSGIYLVTSGELNFADRASSRFESARLVAAVRQATPRHQLLVWGFPSYLYVLADARPPSILAFPPHLFDAHEAGSSGIDELAEVRRILAARPEAVVFQRPLPSSPLNVHTTALVEAYVANCSIARRFMLRDHKGPQTHILYSDCAHR